MGLCYPGTVNGADLPPRRECAPVWQPRFRAALPGIRLTLLVGSYAQNYYLKGKRKATLAETVRSFKEYLPEYFVLPHPSWRNKAWINKNPWFTKIVIPELRRRVKRVLATV
jgi:uracil-DNA glycosylase